MSDLNQSVDWVKRGTCGTSWVELPHTHRTCSDSHGARPNRSGCNHESTAGQCWKIVEGMIAHPVAHGNGSGSSVPCHSNGDRPGVSSTAGTACCLPSCAQGLAVLGTQRLGAEWSFLGWGGLLCFLSSGGTGSLVSTVEGKGQRAVSERSSHLVCRFPQGSPWMRVLAAVGRVSCVPRVALVPQSKKVVAAALRQWSIGWHNSKHVLFFIVSQCSRDENLFGKLWCCGERSLLTPAQHVHSHCGSHITTG